MRMSKEERRERERQKREAWRAELLRLEERQARTERREWTKNPTKEHNRLLLEEIHRMMRGPEFRAWYEATTGEAADGFLSRVIMTPSEYRATGAISHLQTQLEWVRDAVEFVAAKNPWTDPEQRDRWAEEIAGAKDPRERRMILMKMATPRWADRERVLAAYQERERLVKETGIPHDVDHIVPIVHPKVCGLHCEANLRVIPAAENRSKSNFFEIA